MPVPDFQSFLKPLLDLATDGKEHSIREARERLVDTLNLTEEDLAELLPSGQQTKYDNRVQWAKAYFIQAKVFSSPRRGYFQITDRGRELHEAGHSRISIKILNRYPEFVAFHSPPRTKTADTEDSESVLSSSSTPEELLQQAYQSLRNELGNELLSKVKDNTPEFFEHLVVDLMVAMGYGGSRLDAGKSIGRSGDEGIDGIIKEDRLGLDVIYLQAKRWEGSVGRPEIQKFVGALTGKRAKKGVFITTGEFADTAQKYADSIEPKVILIDGHSLANYMIDLNLGVSTTANYQIKRVDSDYFVED